MATTELDKIPDTVLSRSQVYEFRTISTKAIAGAAAHASSTPKGIAVGDDSLQLIAARRRGQHARRAEQARSGDRLHRRARSPPRTSPRCSAWSGAICCSIRCRRWPTRMRRRRSRWPRGRSRWATTCAPSAASSSRVVRDLLVLSVDPSRDQRSGDRRRGRARSPQGARRAVLARGPAARVRSADARRGGDRRRGAAAGITSRWRCCGWMHLRKLVPIEDLIAGARRAERRPCLPDAAAARRSRAHRRRPRLAPATSPQSGRRHAAAAARRPQPRWQAMPRVRQRAGAGPEAPRPGSDRRCRHRRRASRQRQGRAPRARSKRKAVFYRHGGRAGAADRGRPATGVTFTALARASARSRDDVRAAIARGSSRSTQQVAGRQGRRRVRAGDVATRRATSRSTAETLPDAGEPEDRRCESRRSPTPAVQTMLEVFPAEIRDVEEM